MKKVLPLSYQPRYRALKQILEEAYQTLALPDSTVVRLRSEVTALQRFCREQILSLQLDELSSDVQHWVQSYHVEIDKQLRLLEVDIVFLQAARQTVTTEQRRQQVRDRLATLQRYCDVLLGE
ncbi:MAG: heterocyst frequency control protein PatD [Tildeniella nuda ZEHNDER 1965/U140]|nr:heterocyst frequency control protein PatD [Tildeniella nuda ZEHNDER 1965/U140]